MNYKYENITIIGLGMIGASIAHDIRLNKIAKRVTGIDPVYESGAYLLTKGLIKEASTEISVATHHKSDMVIIAAPPSKFKDIARQLPEILADGAIVMDAGSVKTPAIDAIAPHIPDYACYVPAHPIAGKAESGAKSGEAGLFENKRVILTPYREVDETEIAKALDFWQDIGGVCEIMSAENHDMIYGYVSHLPQIIAYAYSLMIKESEYNDNLSKKLSQFLRIAFSPAALWVDIAMSNRTNLFAALQQFLHILSHMRAELSSGHTKGETQEIIDNNILIERLLPRIIASTTISAVHLKEQQSDMRLMPYIGTGFADITAPALDPPEDDIELISKSYSQVERLLEIFDDKLREVTIALEKGDSKKLYNLMQSARNTQANI